MKYPRPMHDAAVGSQTKNIDSSEKNSESQKRNNPQYRPSNTEGCYSLLVSSIIDLTSLSTDWISFLRYPGVT